MPIKKRNPWLVLLFIFITLGIYLIYWIVSTTRELNETTKSAPSIKLLVWYLVLCVLSVVSFVSSFFFSETARVTFFIFIILGFLLYLFAMIIGIIFIWKYSKAIEELSGFPAIGLFLIWIFVGIAMPVIVQYELNKKASGEVVAKPPVVATTKTVK